MPVKSLRPSPGIERVKIRIEDFAPDKGVVGAEVIMATSPDEFKKAA